jgi:hypothetical protein
MKKKKITIFTIIAILLCFATIGCSNKKQTFDRNQLDIVSISENKYVIVLTDTSGEANQYSMYKQEDYNKYEKLYDLDISNNVAIENNHILWDNDKFYLIQYNIVEYDANTGKELYQSKDKITPTDDDELCGTNTNLKRIYGKDNEYIYYNYYCVNNSKEYYARITSDLQNVERIEKSDIPNNLIN